MNSYNGRGGFESYVSIENTKRCQLSCEALDNGQYINGFIIPFKMVHTMVTFYLFAVCKIDRNFKVDRPVHPSLSFLSLHLLSWHNSQTQIPLSILKHGLSPPWLKQRPKKRKVINGIEIFSTKGQDQLSQGLWSNLTQDLKHKIRM